MEYKVFLPSEVVPDNQDTKVYLTQWLCKVGDYVEKGNDIAEVTTDKAVYVVSAPVSGIIEKIFVKDSEQIDPHKPICIINTGVSS